MKPAMQPEWIAPARTALLIVDMQVDFAAADGAMAREGHDMKPAQAAVAQAARLVDAARRAQVPCIFVGLHTRAGDETPALRELRERRGKVDEKPICEEGTRGAEFFGPAPRPGEAVFWKSRYSGFANPGLERHLRGLGRDTLVIAGLTTECCIDATARDAFERDFLVMIAQDAVAAYEPALHRVPLQALENDLATLADAQTIAGIWNNA